MDIEAVKMLFDNLPVDFKDQSRVIPFRRKHNTNDNQSQLDFFQTA